MPEMSSREIASKREAEFEEFHKMREEFNELKTQIEALSVRQGDVARRLVNGLQVIESYNRHQPELEESTRVAYEALKNSVEEYRRKGEELKQQYAELLQLLQSRSEELAQKQQELRKNLH